MTPDQYREAAQAISDYKWILAAALSSVNIRQTKESIKRINQLHDLQSSLEKEGMK